jgi:hypothetical protein
MTTTLSPRVRAQFWALAATAGPALLATAVGLAAAVTVDDTGCEGYTCPSFGYGVLAVFAFVAAPAVGVLGQLATAGLGAAARPLRSHPVVLGLLGAALAWGVLIGYVSTF